MEKHSAVSCGAGVLLFSFQLPLETLPDRVVTPPVSQGSDTDAPRKGSGMFLSLHVHVFRSCF